MKIKGYDLFYLRSVTSSERFDLGDVISLQRAVKRLYVRNSAPPLVAVYFVKDKDGQFKRRAVTTIRGAFFAPRIDALAAIDSDVIISLEKSIPDEAGKDPELLAVIARFNDGGLLIF